jgi:hypothetical protein
MGLEFNSWIGNGIFESLKTATRTNKRKALSIQEVKG